MSAATCFFTSGDLSSNLVTRTLGIGFSFGRWELLLHCGELRLCESKQAATNHVFSAYRREKLRYES